MITTIIVGLIIALLTEETLGWMPHFAKWLIRQNAKRVPTHLIDRCEEEWLAHLDQIPGRVSKLLFSIDSYRASFKISHEHFAPNVSYWVPFFLRIIDFSYAFVFLIMSLPILILVSFLLIIKNSKEPLLTRQLRVGKNNKNFELIKFRTDSSRIGYLIRKFGLNELPQIFNVLKGELSFVGPSPETPERIRRIEQVVPDYSKRHFVRPGLTGWAQIKHPYGSSIKNVKERLFYDLCYVKNLSPLLNLMIILVTFRAVLMRKGSKPSSSDS